MIKYHKIDNKIVIAELPPGSDIINSPDDMLDIMAEARYNDSAGLIIYQNSLNQDFFELRSGLAGEILQKFSNYRMRLAIIGDFSKFNSKSLNDFMRESNTWGTICFVNSTEEALSRIIKK